MVTPEKISVAVLGANAEVVPIPGRHSDRIMDLEENAANASDFFHVIARLTG